MQQNHDNQSFRTKENYGQMFYHSCLGKIIILIGVLALLAIIAVLTVPSEQKMREEINDDIRQCIQENDSIQSDQLDDALGNIMRIVTEADSTIDDKELMANFNKYNKVEIYRHAMYATAYIHNNFRPEGTRVGIGIFGIVIPTVNFNDFLLRAAPMRKDYNDGVIRSTIRSGSNYMGDNPDLGDTYDTYQGGGSSREVTP